MHSRSELPCGKTQLLLAAQNGRAQTVRDLLSEGADVEFADAVRVWF